MRAPSGVFPLAGPGGPHCVSTGEFRPPKKGEAFLSGAIVQGYLAHADMSDCFWIAKPVTLTKCLHCGGSGKVVQKP